MSATENFKTHITECPQCSANAADPSKLCSIAKALIAQIVKENGPKI